MAHYPIYRKRRDDAVVGLEEIDYASSESEAQLLCQEYELCYGGMYDIIYRRPNEDLDGFAPANTPLPEANNDVNNVVNNS